MVRVSPCYTRRGWAGVASPRAQGCSRLGLEEYLDPVSILGRWHVLNPSRPCASDVNSGPGKHPPHYLEWSGVPVTLSQPLNLVLGPSWSVEPVLHPKTYPCLYLLSQRVCVHGVSPYPSFGQLMPPDPASGCHHPSSDGPLTLISALGVSPLPPGLGGHVT